MTQESEEQTSVDDAPQTGQRGTRVYRFSGCPKDSFIQHEPNVTWDNATPGVWHPTDPKALAEMRETLADVASYATDESNGEVTDESITDAFMQALGLTPPEPKEGGAS